SGSITGAPYMIIFRPNEDIDLYLGYDTRLADGSILPGARFYPIFRENGVGYKSSSPAGRPEISYQDAERIMEEAAKEAIAIRIGQLEESKNEALRNNRANIAHNIEEEISRLPLTREQTCELACSLILEKLFREFSIPSLLVSGWAYGSFHCILFFINKDSVFVMDATIRQFAKKKNNYFGPLSEYIRRTDFKDLLVYKNELREWPRGRVGAENFEQFLSRSSSPVKDKGNYGKKLYYVANLAFKKGNYPAALECLKELILWDPQDLNSFVYYLEVANKSKDMFDLAFQKTEEIIGKIDRCPVGYYLRSFFHLKMRNFKMGLKDLNSAVRLSHSLKDKAYYLFKKAAYLDDFIQSGKLYSHGFDNTDEQKSTLLELSLFEISLPRDVIPNWEFIAYVFFIQALVSKNEYESAEHLLSIFFQKMSLIYIKEDRFPVDKYIARAFDLRASIRLINIEEMLISTELSWISGLAIRDDVLVLKPLFAAAASDIKNAFDREGSYLQGRNYLTYMNLFSKFAMIEKNDYDDIIPYISYRKSLSELHQAIARLLRKKGGRRFSLKELREANVDIDPKDIEILKEIKVIGTVQDSPETYYYGDMSIFIVSRAQAKSSFLVSSPIIDKVFLLSNGGKGRRIIPAKVLELDLNEYGKFFDLWEVVRCIEFSAQLPTKEIIQNLLNLNLDYKFHIIVSDIGDFKNLLAERFDGLYVPKNTLAKLPVRPQIQAYIETSKQARNTSIHYWESAPWNRGDKKLILLSIAGLVYWVISEHLKEDTCGQVVLKNFREGIPAFCSEKLRLKLGNIKPGQDAVLGKETLEDFVTAYEEFQSSLANEFNHFLPAASPLGRSPAVGWSAYGGSSPVMGKKRTVVNLVGKEVIVDDGGANDYYLNPYYLPNGNGLLARRILKEYDPRKRHPSDIVVLSPKDDSGLKFTLGERVIQGGEDPRVVCVENKYGLIYVEVKPKNENKEAEFWHNKFVFIDKYGRPISGDYDLGRPGEIAKNAYLTEADGQIVYITRGEGDSNQAVQFYWFKSLEEALNPPSDFWEKNTVKSAKRIVISQPTGMHIGFNTLLERQEDNFKIAILHLGEGDFKGTGEKYYQMAVGLLSKKNLISLGEPVVILRPEELKIESSDGKIRSAKGIVYPSAAKIAGDNIVVYAGVDETQTVWFKMPVDYAIRKFWKEQRASSPIIVRISRNEARLHDFLEDLWRDVERLCDELAGRKYGIDVAGERQVLVEGLRESIDKYLEDFNKGGFKEIAEYAKDKLEQAINDIERDREPDAHWRLIGVISKVAEAYGGLFKERLERRKRWFRDNKVRVWRRKGNVKMAHGIYEIPEGADRPMLGEGESTFDSVWEMLSGIDKEINKELKEKQVLTEAEAALCSLISFLRSKKQSNEGYGLDADDTEKIKGDFGRVEELMGGFQRRYKVNPKEIAQGLLGVVKKIILSGFRHVGTVDSFLDTAVYYLQLRISSLDLIVSRIKEAKLKDARLLVEQRNKDLSDKIKIIISLIKANELDRAAKHIMGMRNRYDIKNEPDLGYLQGILSRAKKSLDGKNRPDALFDMQTVKEAVSWSDFIRGIIARFRDELIEIELKEKRILGDQEQYQLLLRVLLSTIKLTGPPQRQAKQLFRAWARVYQAAFIPLNIDNPLKKSQRIPNPAFEAATKYIYILDINKIGILLSKTRQLNKGNFAATRAFLEEVRNKAKRDYLMRLDLPGLVEA
ncbi:hypothetical protein D4R78_06530, partial [bacterium]